MRVRKYRFSLNTLSRHLIEGQTAHIKSGLPEGSKILDIRFDTRTLQSSLIVEHEGFDDLPESAEIPEGVPIVIEYREDYA